MTRRQWHPLQTKQRKLTLSLMQKCQYLKKWQGAAFVAAEENASNVMTSATKNQQKSPDDIEADFVASMAAMHH